MTDWTCTCASLAQALDLWMLDLLPSARAFHVLELALKVPSCARLIKKPCCSELDLVDDARCRGGRTSAKLLSCMMPQVLAAMPARLDLLRSSGVLATVSERLSGHPNHVIRDAAAVLSARWQGRPLPKAAPEPAAAAAAPAPQGAACSSCDFRGSWEGLPSYSVLSFIVHIQDPQQRTHSCHVHERG